MSEKELIQCAKHYESKGDKERAIKLYEMVDDGYYVIHAAKIAIELKHYDQARELIKKGRNQCEKDRLGLGSRNFRSNLSASGLSKAMCWSPDYLSTRDVLDIADNLEKRIEKENNGGLSTNE